MSRFHDEFFKQGSPAHDTLMIKCLSKKGIAKICDAIDTFSEVRKACPERPIMICCLDDSQLILHFGSLDHTFVESYSGDQFCRYKHDSPPTCKIWRFCQYGKDGVFPEFKRISPEINISDIEMSKETEVIIKNGHFIIGYADAVIDLIYKGTLSYRVHDELVWRNAEKVNEKVKILIEAKPKITSIGEVIRQLKTYKEIVSRDVVRREEVKVLPVIVTYSTLNEDALEYLANEGISVVVFEESE